ncbi:MAG: DUF2802 domain-containing protein [Desulfococcaceae bacterium]
MELNWQDMAFWELVLDGVALLLCGLAVIALIVWRKERSASAVPAAYGRGFDGGSGSPESRFRASEWAEADIPNLKAGGAARKSPGGPKTDLYDQAAELAAAGLSVSAVAEELGLPRGEVELALKFRRIAPPEPETPAAVIPLQDTRTRTSEAK